MKSLSRRCRFKLAYSHTSHHRPLIFRYQTKIHKNCTTPIPHTNSTNPTNFNHSNSNSNNNNNNNNNKNKNILRHWYKPLHHSSPPLPPPPPFVSLSGPSFLQSQSLKLRHHHFYLLQTIFPHSHSVIVTRRHYTTKPEYFLNYDDDRLEKKLKTLLDPKYRPLHTHRRTTPLAVDGEFVTLDNIFLRDACQCPECVDPSTKQKTFQTSSIPKDIRASGITSYPDGSVGITWSAVGSSNSSIPASSSTSTSDVDSTHKSIYSIDQLRLFSNVRYRIRARYNDQAYILWDRKLIEQDLQFVDYDEYMKNDQVLLFTLLQLMRYGLIFLKNVPTFPYTVESIAERIGPIKTTFYGKSWDVKSVPDSKNIAYTNLDLGLHMDLLYFASPPGVQFLHCIKNSVSVRGGSSYFADSFRAAEWIRINSPNNFQSLLTFPVTFHYKNDGHHYHFIRPTIELEEHSFRARKRIAHVNYSPPFQAPFEIDIGHPAPAASFRQFYSALKLFASQVDEPENQFELKLNPGECVIFKNRRVLHARREFDATSGDRWLKGTYIDTDVYLSKFRVLTSKYVKTRPTADDDDLDFIR